MRKANPATDFTVTLDDVGDFVYGRRTLGDSLRIRARYLALVGEHGDDIEMSAISSAAATHEVLCVSCPEGWVDLLKVDATDPARIGQVFNLAAKLGEKEDSFRDQAQGNGAPAGA